jgi:very-short-patch-repair endonuclease
MRHKYYRKKLTKKESNIIIGILALFSLGLWNFYKANPQKIYIHFGYVFFATIGFFLIRHLIRKYKKRNTPLYSSIKLQNNEHGNEPSSHSESKIGQTKYSRLLWAALKERGLDAITEYNDGHKHIDIAILSAKLYIEVDGVQHAENIGQAIADLKRDNYSDKEGFRTIRISNESIHQNLNEIADEIAKQAHER